MRAVNLIPSEQRPGGGSLAGRSGGAALVVLGVIVGVAVLAYMYGSAAHQISKESGEVAKLQTQTEQVRARTGRLTPYTSFVTMAQQRTKTVAQLVQARFDWSHVMRELGRVLPSDSALSTLNGSANGTGTGGGSSSGGGGATPVSSTPPGSTPSIELSGCSKSQTEVAQTLQRLRLIDGVSEVHLASATKSSAGETSSGSGGCGAGEVAFQITVSFQALPATPIPSVPAPTVPASATSAKGAHAEQVSTSRKGAGR